VSSIASLLAFDFGTKRVGIASGQVLTNTATPLEVLPTPELPAHWLGFDKLLKTWRPDAMVVGLPLSESGHDQAITTAARTFAQALLTRYKKPVFLVDERFSSKSAESAFVASRQSGGARRKDFAKLDAVAAAIILESYFAHGGHPLAA
jgi:putative holliday junction resolvase